MTSPRKLSDIDVRLNVLEALQKKFRNDLGRLTVAYNNIEDKEKPMIGANDKLEKLKSFYHRLFEKYVVYLNQMLFFEHEFVQLSLSDLQKERVNKLRVYFNNQKSFFENPKIKKDFVILCPEGYSRVFYKCYFEEFYLFENGFSQDLSKAEKGYLEYVKQMFLTKCLDYISDNKIQKKLEGLSYNSLEKQIRRNSIPDDYVGDRKNSLPDELEYTIQFTQQPLFYRHVEENFFGVLSSQNHQMDVQGADFLLNQNRWDASWKFDERTWFALIKFHYHAWLKCLRQLALGLTTDRGELKKNKDIIRQLSDNAPVISSTNSKMLENMREVDIFWHAAIQILSNIIVAENSLKTYLEFKKIDEDIGPFIVEEINIEQLFEDIANKKDKGNSDIESNLRRLLPQEFMPNQEGFESEQNTHPMVWMNNIQTSPYYDPDLPYTYNPDEEQYIPELPRDVDGNMIEFQPSWMSVINEALDTVEEVYENHPEVIEIPAAAIGTKVVSQKLAPAIQKAIKTGSLNRINNVVRTSSTTSPMRTDYSRGINYNGYMLGGANGFGGGSAKSYSK